MNFISAFIRYMIFIYSMSLPKPKYQAILGIIRHVVLRLINQTSFLHIYYKRSELVWLDGFLFDFLQKKSLDVWLRKFVVNTGYIFSERMVFDQVVSLYLDNLV